MVFPINARLTGGPENMGHMPPFGYILATYQNPPLSPPAAHYDAPAFPLRPNRTSRQPGESTPPPPPPYTPPETSAPAHISAPREDEIATLKQEIASKDERIAELEAEAAELRRSSRESSGTTDTQERLFRDMLTKYKNVKRLYFDGKSQIEALTKQVEELRNSENTPDGKDKIIQAWKEQYDKLSAQVRSQNDAEAVVNLWKEKHETLLTQHTSSLENASRTERGLRAENDRLARELETTKESARQHAETAAESKKIIAKTLAKLEGEDGESSNRLDALNDDKMYLERRLSQYLQQLEKERQDKVKMLNIMDKLGALWHDAQNMLVECGPIASQAQPSDR